MDRKRLLHLQTMRSLPDRFMLRYVNDFFVNDLVFVLNLLLSAKNSFGKFSGAQETLVHKKHVHRLENLQNVCLNFLRNKLNNILFTIVGNVKSSAADPINHCETKSGLNK